MTLARDVTPPYAVRTIDPERRFDPLAGEPVSMHNSVEDAARTIANAGKRREWRVVKVRRPGVYTLLQGEDVYALERALDPDRSAA